MYYVYAVVIGLDGQKSRYHCGQREGEFMAKHLANAATCGSADYAYVKDSAGSTVFFIRRPEYEGIPQDQARPQGQLVKLDLQRQTRRRH